MFRLFFRFFLIFTLSGMAFANDFLEVDEAFKLKVEVRENHQLATIWDIANGYKLYKSSLKVKAVNSELNLGELQLPAAKAAFDKGLNQVVETYQHQVTGTLTLPENKDSFILEVNYQGCAIEGLCYPPQSRLFKIDPNRIAPQEIAPEATFSPALPASPAGAIVQSASIQSVLRGGDLWAIGLAFLAFGLLLSLTPCVLPMLPILSSIIVGQQKTDSKRSFFLAVSYSMGMALVYTVLGISAGLVGEGLAAFMQQPWVLILFSLLLTIMALSMFDVYQLQLPASWQSWMSQGVGRFQGGKYLSVFVMGALSSLIVGPCVAGPLAGALIYISQTHDVFIGGFALFVMACGMSVPLLLTGLSADSLLPRAGNWMTHIKTVFGFMLFGVALWMINPLLNDQFRLMSWGALLVIAAFFTPLIRRTHDAHGFFTKLASAIGLLLLLAGSAEFLGGMMGGTDLLTPIKSAGVAESRIDVKHVVFERISGESQLNELLKNSDQPVLLDFYADWCTSCLEMEKFTFTDPMVISKMQNWRRLQIDVTKNTPQDREIMRRFQVFGPPAMIFFNKNGSEMSDFRLIGFLSPTDFQAHLDSVNK